MPSAPKPPPLTSIHSTRTKLFAAISMAEAVFASLSTTTPVPAVPLWRFGPTAVRVMSRVALVVAPATRRTGWPGPVPPVEWAKTLSS